MLLVLDAACWSLPAVHACVLLLSLLVFGAFGVLPVLQVGLPGGSASGLMQVGPPAFNLLLTCFRPAPDVLQVGLPGGSASDLLQGAAWPSADIVCNRHWQSAFQRTAVLEFSRDRCVCLCTRVNDAKPSYARDVTNGGRGAGVTSPLQQRPRQPVILPLLLLLRP
eukprot:GHRQ01019224.1.p1 GENE.GHRQ01019224.1~~GHRQ01019224.1.p1  ORF type:complete len:166 (+),score=20.59 GHRQ01019224.1:374-871(+)